MIKGTNLERLRPLIENYNDKFNINSDDWYHHGNFTDIYQI